MTKKTFVIVVSLILCLTCVCPSAAFGEPGAAAGVPDASADAADNQDPASAEPPADDAADDADAESTAPPEPADDQTGTDDPVPQDPGDDPAAQDTTDPQPATDPQPSTSPTQKPAPIVVVKESRTIWANHTLKVTKPSGMTGSMKKWTTSNKRIATVSAAGVIKARKLGKAVIRGYDSNGKLRKIVNVKVVLGRDYTLFVAYRGMSRVAPENTLPAFREAVKAGYGGIELDIWESRTTAKSSPPLILVMHDNNLKYKTGKNKKTYKVNWANRKSFKIRRHVKGLKKYGPQTIPSLNEAFRCIYKQAKASGRKNFVVEIDVKNKLSDRAVKHIIRIVGKHRVHILCANIKTLRKFKKYRKYRTTEIWCCTGSNKASVRNKKIRNAHKYHFDGISLPIRNVNVATVRKVRSYGMKMGIYGATSAAQVQKWKSYGVCRFNMAPKVFR